MMPAKTDTQKDIAKLRTQLRRLKYPDEVDDSELAKGGPSAYLPLVHYLLLEASKRVAKFIANQGYDLSAKSDYKFIESVYEILRIHFNYRPPCTLTQFFAEGYGEVKVRLLLDVATAVMARHNALAQLSPKPKAPTDRGLDYSGHTHLSFAQTPGSDERVSDEQFRIEARPSPSAAVTQRQAQTSTAAAGPEKETAEEAKRPMIAVEEEPAGEFNIEQIQDLLRELKGAVKEINGKVEKIQESVGLKLANIQAEVVLLNGKLNFIENNMPRLAPNNNQSPVSSPPQAKQVAV